MKLRIKARLRSAWGVLTTALALLALLPLGIVLIAAASAFACFGFGLPALLGYVAGWLYGHAAEGARSGRRAALEFARKSE